MRVGQTHNVEIVMRNTGSATWKAEQFFRLGSQSPQDNNTWVTSGRIDLASPVDPGKEAVFRFQVTAPPNASARTFQWRMVQDGLEWFGQFTPALTISLLGQPVQYGSSWKFGHLLTGVNLWTWHVFMMHGGTSKQQLVAGHIGPDDNLVWRIKGPHEEGPEFKSGQPVQHGDVVRLEHTGTSTNLHSHRGFPSPITSQQEVSCFGQKGVGDGNDNWRVEIESNGGWEAGKPVRLIHVNTGVALHSHGGYSDPTKTFGKQEVTGYSGRDGNDKWFAY
jgi:dolichyl-phosphate-mannose--protein O-mannosyl transferase